MSREYIAFISYRHTPLSMKVAKKIHSTIEQYNIPRAMRKNGKKHFGPVFRDQEELPVSSNLSSDICNALDHSEFLIVVCTPDTPGSIWVSREIEYFLQNHSRDKVLAVLAQGEPLDSFPEQLRTEIDPETGIKREVEPLAADIRGKSDKEILSNISKESPRLFAAMIGCPYDALVMREQKRKRKKILWISSLILAVVSAFAVFALINNIQLNQKNDKLKKQKEELQRQQEQILWNESELLTGNSEEALANEEYLYAARYAASALPQDENDDRPYYAPAERALIKALDIFNDRNDKFWMVDTELATETKIVSYACSEDGRYIVTLDAYGTVTMFDSVSGELLWCKQTDNTYTFDNKPVFFEEKDLVIIGGTYKGISAFNIGNGEEIWKYYTDFYYCESGLIQSNDKKSIVFVQYKPDDEKSFSTYDYELIQLSCETGEVVMSCLLVDDTDLLSVEVPDSRYLGSTNPWGCFDKNDEIFAGSYIASNEEYKRQCIYYTVELTSGKIKIVYTSPFAELSYNVEHLPMAMMLDSDKKELKIAAVPLKETVAAVFLRIDIETSEILSSAETPETEDVYFFGTDTQRALFTDKALIVSVDKYIYLFNVNNGQYSVQGMDESPVVGLFYIPVDDAFFFAYVTEDGVYTYAWTNGTQIISAGSDKLFKDGLSLAFESCGGSYKPIVENGSVKGADTGHEAQGLGYVAVLSDEDKNTVTVYRAKPIEKESDKSFEYISEDESVTGCFIPIGNDKFAVGPIRDSADGTEFYSCYYKIYDNNTYKKSAELACKEEYSASNIYFFPDLSGYIYDDYGSIIIHDSEKASFETLFENEEIALDVINDIQYVVARYAYSIGTLSDTGDVILAVADGETLSVYKNGVKDIETDMSELNWYRQTRGSRQRFIVTGSNGYILLSNYEKDPEEDKISDFAVFNISDQSFSLIPDKANGSSSRIFTMAESEPLFAVSDDDGYIRVYDISQKKLISEIKITIPKTAIKKMIFADKDELLLISTSDNQLLICDVDSGEYLFREDIAFYDISAVTDPENNRIYIYNDMNKALCIEMETWNLIVEFDEFMLYNSEKNEILLKNYWIASNIVTPISLPSTYGLVEKANKITGIS